VGDFPKVQIKNRGGRGGWLKHLIQWQMTWNELKNCRNVVADVARELRAPIANVSVIWKPLEMT
jgi:hypothetical protein